jgi:hypothetical protein
LEKSDFPHPKAPRNLSAAVADLSSASPIPRAVTWPEDTLCCNIKITSIQIDSSDGGPLSSPITRGEIPKTQGIRARTGATGGDARKWRVSAQRSSTVRAEPLYT